MQLRKASVLKSQDYGTLSGVRFLPEGLDSSLVLLHPRDPRGAVRGGADREVEGKDRRAVLMGNRKYGQMLINAVSGLPPNPGGPPVTEGQLCTQVSL